MRKKIVFKIIFKCLASMLTKDGIISVKMYKPVDNLNIFCTGSDNIMLLLYSL